DEAAGANDRLGHERRDLAARLGQDQLFEVLGALQPAGRILSAERAAVAVRGMRVVDPRDERGQLLPPALAAPGERLPAAAGVAVPQRDDLHPPGRVAGGV